MSRFSKIVKFKALEEFTSPDAALSNMQAVAKGEVSEALRTFLERSLPRVKPEKLSKFWLGVAERGLAGAIQTELRVRCRTDDTVNEVLRGVRLHFTRFVPSLGSGLLEKSQLALAHNYSRATVAFNVNRVDNMIIQSIFLLDQLDKDVNTFSMRVKEWFGYHFPELALLVKDNYMYAKVAAFMRSRSFLKDDMRDDLAAVVMDEALAGAIMDAAKTSMGMDVLEVDVEHIDEFCRRLVSLAEYRHSLFGYLEAKMGIVAPNLSALIGDLVAARLISHAGSLTNLAKCPASTIQILGAEKALFRALKTRGNTPKFGLIFHSKFIGRASAKDKGRIARYLANKCAIAARIDAFDDTGSAVYGTFLRDQVEERLSFCESGETPRKNVDVMREAAVAAAAAAPAPPATAGTGPTVPAAAVDGDSPEKERKHEHKHKHKRRHEDGGGDEEEKHKHKDKKRKREEGGGAGEEGEKRQKHKHKHRHDGAS